MNNIQQTCQSCHYTKWINTSWPTESKSSSVCQVTSHIPENIVIYKHGPARQHCLTFVCVYHNKLSAFPFIFCLTFLTALRQYYCCFNNYYMCALPHYFWALHVEVLLFASTIDAQGWGWTVRCVLQWGKREREVQTTLIFLFNCFPYRKLQTTVSKSNYE